MDYMKAMAYGAVLACAVTTPSVAEESKIVEGTVMAARHSDQLEGNFFRIYAKNERGIISLYCHGEASKDMEGKFKVGDRFKANITGSGEACLDDFISINRLPLSPDQK